MAGGKANIFPPPDDNSDPQTTSPDCVLVNKQFQLSCFYDRIKQTPAKKGMLDFSLLGRFDADLMPRSGNHFNIFSSAMD